MRVYDYVDAQVPMLARMFKKRIADYEVIGYCTASTEEAESPPLQGSTG